MTTEIFEDQKTPRFTSQTREESNLKKLTKKVIDPDQEREDIASVTSSVFIRRKIEDAALQPRSTAQQKDTSSVHNIAQSAAFNRFIDQIETETLLAKKIAQERRDTNQKYDKFQHKVMMQRGHASRQLEAF